MSTRRVEGGRRAAFGPFEHSTRNQVARVQDSTAPAAIINPGGTPTVINPGDSWASKITTAGTNGTLWVTKGNHTISSAVAPLAGQTFVCESAAGFTRTSADSAIMDGGATATEQMLWTNVDGVTIRGGVWQNQGNSSSTNNAAPFQTTSSGTNFLVEDAIIQQNYQRGAGLGGNNNIMRRVWFKDNGRIGFACSNGTGNMLDKCRFSGNNTRSLDPGAGGSEAGTMKVAGTTNGFIVQECWVHDNIGFGPWIDVTTTGDYKFLQNVVEHNIFAGLFFENVRGGCVMERNYVKNNGYDTTGIGTVPHAFENKAQIRITGADSSLGSGIRGSVYRNIVDYDLTQDSVRGGLFLIWDHTAALPECKNWDIRENQFWLRNATTRRIRGQDTDGSAPNLWDDDIDFIHNEYHVVNNTTDFWNWDTGTGQGVQKSYAAWQGYHPGEDLAQIVIP